MTRRAVLQPQHVGQRFQLSRYPVSEALAPWLDLHWIVEWDLPVGQVHEQRLLPFPNANLAFEAGQTALHGVARARWRCGGSRAAAACTACASSAVACGPGSIGRWRR